MTTKGECSRCGKDESMFWYPYAFGVAPLPTPAGGYRDCQFYTLCDDCQQDFVDFMHNKRWPFFDADKLKKMMDEAGPMPLITDLEVKEAKE